MNKLLYLCSILMLTVLLMAPSSVFARGPVPPSDTSGTSGSTTSSPCDFAGNDKPACLVCMGPGKEAVWTAFGCLPTDSGMFVTKLLQFGSGIAGGIAFLLIIIGGFQIVMSAGNPEKLNEGRELVTSAIVGLMFIIFSIFLLRLIGVDILGIPGFE